MTKFSLITMLVLTLAFTVAMSAWCFSSGLEVLGAINAAMALVNLISIAKLN